MNRWVKTAAAAVITAQVGPILLAGAAAPGKSAVSPATTASHASAEPTEAQLPPVAPAWRRNGWHAVVPHAYVIRALAPARIRPEVSAPAAFWIKGGVRVPILEQRREWWCVGWIHGQTGWMPAADLQPHATFVFIDARTGRVLRRLAAKGEQGAVSDGRFLWSFSDTGITRTSLGEPPSIWSNPVHAGQEDSLPQESVWTPDRSAFFARAKSDGNGPLVRVSTGAGTLNRIGYPGRYLRNVHADAEGRLLRAVGPDLELYDLGTGHKIRTAGRLLCIAQDRSIYAGVKSPDGKPDLIHYDPDLRPLARLKLKDNLRSGCLSADGRILALADEGGIPTELRRSDTLARIATLHHGSENGPCPLALATGVGGWWIIGSGEQDPYALDALACVTHYTRQGQLIRTWEGANVPAVMSPDGRHIYMPRASDLAVFDTEQGTSHHVPYRWRRPLPRRYLPEPSDPDTPTHLEISALTLTPDGRTLILTEYPNGDPER